MDNRICKHCGQLLMAGLECTCGESQLEKRIEIQKVKAAQAIDEVFGSLCEGEGYEPLFDDEIVILKDLACKVAERRIAAVTLTLYGGTKAKLVRGAKGKVKIERSESRNTSAEVDG